MEQQRAPVAGGARGALGPGAQFFRTPVHGVHLLVVKIQPRAGAEVAHARHGQRVADVVLQEPHKGVHGGRRGRAPVGRSARGAGAEVGSRRGARAARPGRGAGAAPGTRAPPAVIVPESTALPIGCSRLGAEPGGRGAGGGGGGLEAHRHSRSQTRAITAGARFAEGGERAETLNRDNDNNNSLAGKKCID